MLSWFLAKQNTDPFLILKMVIIWPTKQKRKEITDEMFYLTKEETKKKRLVAFVHLNVLFRNENAFFCPHAHPFRVFTSSSTPIRVYCSAIKCMQIKIHTK